jgi:hypothetical protein
MATPQAGKLCKHIQPLRQAGKLCKHIQPLRNTNHGRARNAYPGGEDVIGQAAGCAAPWVAGQGTEVAAGGGGVSADNTTKHIYKKPKECECECESECECECECECGGECE